MPWFVRIEAGKQENFARSHARRIKIGPAEQFEPESDPQWIDKRAAEANGRVVIVVPIARPGWLYITHAKRSFIGATLSSNHGIEPN